MKLLKTHRFKFISEASSCVVFNFSVQETKRYSFEYSKRADDTLLSGEYYSFLTNNDPYHL